jgi:hypothetical protein
MIQAVEKGGGEVRVVYDGFDCNTIIDIIILYIHTNDAYTYDTGRGGGACGVRQLRGRERLLR